MGHDAVRHRVSAVFLVLLAAAMMWQFHDRTWWGPDDGAYAHIADRMVRGEVLNGSIYDIHLGLVHFLHAAVFKIFGTSMVGLRYPLAALTVIQCMIVFWLFRERNWLIGLAGGIAMASLTFVQYLNPTANWYALFTTIVLIAVAAGAPREAAWRYGLLGALLMIVFMFRQLTGALVGIGLVTWLLSEDEHRSCFAKPWLGRIVLALCGLVLGLYLARNASTLSILLFGIGPMLLIGAAWRNCVMADRAVLRMAAQMTLGAAIAIAPLIAYHISHGSLYSWFDDTVLTSLRLTALPFIDKVHYYILPLLAARAATEGFGPASIVNVVFWTILLLAPMVLGWVAASRAWRGRDVPVLAYMAVFFALVSAHYEIPIYLFYSTALTLCGILALSADWSRMAQGIAGVLVLALAAVGFWSHAGQPITRGYKAVAAGQRVPLQSEAIAHRVGLHLAPGEREFYEWLVGLIMKHSKPQDSILALPVNPELYFMTGRRNPTRFFNSALGLRNEIELQELLSTLVVEAPAMVIFNSKDKYVTPEALTVVEKIRGSYVKVASRDGVDVYVRRR